MKYSTIAVLTLIASASAASTTIPACATSCLDDATKSATKCAIGDYACICEPSNFSAIQTAATSCVIAACGADVALSKSFAIRKKRKEKPLIGGVCGGLAASMLIKNLFRPGPPRQPGPMRFSQLLLRRARHIGTPRAQALA